VFFRINNIQQQQQQQQQQLQQLLPERTFGMVAWRLTVVKTECGKPALK